jgi:undecaprenyl-diphosphatase
MDNNSLFFLIYNLRHQSPQIDQLMIFGANYLIYILVLVVIFFGFSGKFHQQRASALAVLSMVIVLGLTQAIHLFIAEPRPFTTYNLTPLVKNPGTLSFPSLHTALMSAMAFAFTFYRSKFGPWFLGAMLWVGFARIYVGVHYPLDILGGIITGLAAAAFAWFIKGKLKKRFF